MGITGLALITFVCFHLDFGVARTGFVFVILIALVSLLGSTSTSVVLSFLAVACLNYFFAPPLFEFRVDVPDDIERMAVFLTTSLVVSALTSKLKRSENELRQNQYKLEKAQRIAHFGWWERDFTTKHVSLSDEVSRIFGVQPVDLPEWHGRWLDLIHPEDRARAAEAAAAALSPGGPRYDVEYRVVRPDGTLRVIHSQGDVTWDHSGRALRQFGVLHDITELKQTERELRASEARFRTLVDHASDAFFLYNEDATVLDVNRQACENLGYRRDELIGRTAFDYGPDLTPELLLRIRERLRAGKTVTYDGRHRRKDGTVFPVEVRIRPFWHEGQLLAVSLDRDITARKRAEETLRESEAKLEEAQRVAHVGYWEYDFVTRRYTFSSETFRIFGLTPRESTSAREVFKLVHSEDRDIFNKAITLAVNGGPRYDTEYRVVQPDGVVRFVHSQGDVRWDSGRAISMFGTVQDITDRKLAEQALRASEERFRTLVQFSFDVYWESDAQHRFIRQEFAEGLADAPAPGSEIGKTRWEVPYLQPDEEGWRKHRETLDAHLPFRDFELARPAPDGGKRYVSVSGLPVFDGAGRFIGYRGVGRHITERKRAEDELRASEERFRTVVHFSFEVYWETDTQHRFTRVEYAPGLVEAPVSEIGKRPWELRNFEADAEAWRKHREAVDAHLPFRDFEIARRTPDGSKRYMSVSGLPVFDESGGFVGYRGAGRDITERKTAEEALRRSEAYLAEAQRLSHTGTSVSNASGNLYWSEECYRIWELDPLQGLPTGKAVLQRIHPDDRDRVREEIRKDLHQKREQAIEFRIVRPDGTVKHVETFSHSMFSAQGEIVEVVATHVDVTERRRAQELESDLAHMNRLSIMGELTASLAHEILHPIATARNNARAGMRFLEMSPPNLAEAMEALGCVVRDADRSKDIVDRIRNHIKKAPPRIEPFDLNEAIGEVLVMVQNAIERNRVSVRTSLVDQMSCVRGDRVQVQQVLLNLILNAVDAMSSAEEGARELTISTEPSQTEGILVAVRDSGPGINPEHLDQIFNPFYTTKTSGIGMGLSICRSIIDAHGGRLWAEANQPRGAILQFTLRPAWKTHESSSHGLPN
ncbi:PAS domain S-box protein [Bradyrhizobium sp. CCBAU 051011]|uniref:PAS domain S-box protein n=1 Tax=Bradyrhizobium sp. CCBAU 051011 TaxID=858422 RepID=UPI00137ADD86|nr:PAS domain S-box protein [Bradyrhizobium sp. CCBAU 051011]